MICEERYTDGFVSKLRNVSCLSRTVTAGMVSVRRFQSQSPMISCRLDFECCTARPRTERIAMKFRCSPSTSSKYRLSSISGSSVQ